MSKIQTRYKNETNGEARAYFYVWNLNDLFLTQLDIKLPLLNMKRIQMSCCWILFVESNVLWRIFLVYILRSMIELINKSVLNLDLYYHNPKSLPNVNPPFVHWTRPARFPTTQLITAVWPTATEISDGGITKYCCCPNVHPEKEK